MYSLENKQGCLTVNVCRGKRVLPARKQAKGQRLHQAAIYAAPLLLFDISVYVHQGTMLGNYIVSSNTRYC